MPARICSRWPTAWGHAGGDVAASTIITRWPIWTTRPLRRRSHRCPARPNRLANAQLGDRVRRILPSRDGHHAHRSAPLPATSWSSPTSVTRAPFSSRDGGHQITRDRSVRTSSTGRINRRGGADPSAALLVVQGPDRPTRRRPDVVVRQAIPGDRYLIAATASPTMSPATPSTRSCSVSANPLMPAAPSSRSPFGRPDNVTVVIGDVVDLRSARPHRCPRPSWGGRHPQGHPTDPGDPGREAAALTKGGHRLGCGSEDVRRSPGRATDPPRPHSAHPRGPRGRRDRPRRWSVCRVVVDPVAVLGGRGPGRPQPRHRPAPGAGVALASSAAPTSRPPPCPTSIGCGSPVAWSSTTARTPAPLLRSLAVQARAYEWFRDQLQTCRSVTDDWTQPTPSPSPGPSPSDSASPARRLGPADHGPDPVGVTR